MTNRPFFDASDLQVLQPELALSREGVATYVWDVTQTRILIEVHDDGRVFVNGQEVHVEPPRGQGPA